MPNISQIQVGTTTYDLIDNTKAPINSPNFTGIPQAPTATSTDDSNQIATTKFVQNLFSSISNFEITSCPISSTTEDLPSSWQEAGIGFYSISTSNTLIDQPTNTGIIYNLIENSETTNVIQFLFDYNLNEYYSRNGVKNITNNIDNWTTPWIYFNNSVHTIRRQINGLNINNLLYTDDETQIIRVADDNNNPVIKLIEYNSSSTGKIIARIVLQRPNNLGENKTNYFGLQLDEEGNSTYEISNRNSFKQALGLSTYVSDETLYVKF